MPTVGRDDNISTPTIQAPHLSAPSRPRPVTPKQNDYYQFIAVLALVGLGAIVTFSSIVSDTAFIENKFSLHHLSIFTSDFAMTRWTVAHVCFLALAVISRRGLAIICE